MERCCYRSEHRFEESELVDYFVSILFVSALFGYICFRRDIAFCAFSFHL